MKREPDSILLINFDSWEKSQVFIGKLAQRLQDKTYYDNGSILFGEVEEGWHPQLKKPMYIVPIRFDEAEITIDDLSKKCQEVVEEMKILSQIGNIIT